MELVLADPGLIPGAIEEMLRLNPPSQYQGRFTTRDVAFEGGTIPAGSPTLLVTGAATRDPRAYDQPDAFDIKRGGATTLAFGYGAHSCLGSWLARLESTGRAAAVPRTLATVRRRHRWPTAGDDVQRRRLLPHPGARALMAAAHTAEPTAAPDALPASIPELLALRRAHADGEFLVTDRRAAQFRRSRRAVPGAGRCAAWPAEWARAPGSGSCSPTAHSGSSPGWLRPASVR